MDNHTSTHNALKVVMLKFPHLAEKILQKLDNQGLAKSREVDQVWQTFIDERDYSWLSIVNIPTVRPKEKTYFHLAAEHGQIDAFKMILNEDNNADPKDDWGVTPYLIACGKGRMNIVSMLMKKSKELSVDLNKRDNGCRTAFHLACEEGHSDIATLIMKNSSKLKIKLIARASRRVDILVRSASPFFLSERRSIFLFPKEKRIVLKRLVST